jgi:hypothetical protein
MNYALRVLNWHEENIIVYGDTYFLFFSFPPRPPTLPHHYHPLLACTRHQHHHIDQHHHHASLMSGWSIGGYSAACAAALHPAIRGLVIDASFASIEPLARSAMPPLFGTLLVFLCEINASSFVPLSN